MAERLYNAQYSGIPVEERVFGTEEAALRPSFIQTIRCRNVLFQGFRVEDGLNPDSCKGVLVEGCTFDTGDDCIAINAGMNEDGWRVGVPCENIEIRDCVMNGGHGAVVIGSAVSGGVRNVYAHHCRIRDTMQGIRIKSMRGRGGYVEDAVFCHMDMENVSDQAVQINMFYEFSTVMPKSDVPSRCRNITIRDIRGGSAGTGIQIKGLPECRLRDIALENIDLEAADAFDCSNVDGICMKNVAVKACPEL